MGRKNLTVDDHLRDFARANPPTDPHPDLEELAAFADDLLVGERRDAIRRHVVRCSPCAQLLADLIDDPGEERTGEEEGLSEAELAAGWQAIEADLPKLKEAASPEPIPRLEPVLPFPRSPGRPWLGALAAALAILLLGQSWLLWGQWRRAESLDQRLAEKIAAAGDLALGKIWPGELLPLGEEPLRGGKPLPELEAPAEAEGLSIRLLGADLGAFEEFEIRLLSGAEGEEEAVVRGLAAPDGTVLLHLGLAGRSPGPYRFELYGVRGEERERLESYTARLVRTPTP